MLGMLQQAATTPLAERVLLTLAHFLWQGAALAVLAMLGGMLSRTARGRYAVQAVALCAMLACPAVTAIALGPLPQRTAMLPPAASVPPPAEPPRLSATAVTNLPTPAEAWRLQVAVPWLLAAYAAGVLVLSLRTAAGLAANRRLRRTAVPCTDPTVTAALRRQMVLLGVRAEPLLAFSREVAAPALVGFLKPLILLPTAIATRLSPAQLELVLAHELAHQRRLDPLFVLLQRGAETWLFFHPGVWYVSNRMSHERELCCDDLVVAAGASPLSYADALVRTAELTLGAGRPGLLTLSAGGASSRFGLRVRRLLGEREEAAAALLPWPVGLGLLLVPVLLAAGGSYLPAEEDEGKGTPPAATARESRIDLPDPARDVEVDLRFESIARTLKGEQRSGLAARRFVRLGESTVFGETDEVRVHGTITKIPTDDGKEPQFLTRLSIDARKSDSRLAAPAVTSLDDQDAEVRVGAEIAKPLARPGEPKTDFEGVTLRIKVRAMRPGSTLAQEQSAIRMQKLALAIGEYRAVHKAWPDKLTDLAADFPGVKELLANPRTGSNPGYRYVKPDSEQAAAVWALKDAMLWELKDGKIDPEGLIGYKDGTILSTESARERAAAKPGPAGNAKPTATKIEADHIEIVTEEGQVPSMRVVGRGRVTVTQPEAPKEVAPPPAPTVRTGKPLPSVQATAPAMPTPPVAVLSARSVPAVPAAGQGRAAEGADRRGVAWLQQHVQEAGTSCMKCHAPDRADQAPTGAVAAPALPAAPASKAQLEAWAEETRAAKAELAVYLKLARSCEQELAEVREMHAAATASAADVRRAERAYLEAQLQVIRTEAAVLRSEARLKEASSPGR